MTDVTVPREPTEAMIEAYFAACERHGFFASINATTAWSAMVAAAPKVEPPPMDDLDNLARVLNLFADGREEALQHGITATAAAALDALLQLRGERDAYENTIDGLQHLLAKAERQRDEAIASHEYWVAQNPEGFEQRIEAACVRLATYAKDLEEAREALREIVAECNNGGYPNQIVATRMIERIEETASRALGDGHD